MDATADESVEAVVGRAVERLFEIATVTEPGSITALVDVVADALGATGTSLYAADYALRTLCQVHEDGRPGAAHPIEGSIAGRAFATGEIVRSVNGAAVLWVPLVEGTERLGVLELRFPGDLPDDALVHAEAVLDGVVTTLVLLLVSKRRYTDAWLRARRVRPLSPAAEAQWDLLPPLSGAIEQISVAGIVEPAYAIGGDSFDYAFNRSRVDFAIIDAIGHGMSAVLMSTVAVNSLRNVRRQEGDLTTAYRQTDRIIAEQFGRAFYVTGQIGTLESSTGVLTWLNAGHVLPLLVRNGTYAGELACRPSLPMGLGGPIVEIGTETLQRGDRVLFYTDGVTESRAPDGAEFGIDRLADFLVRATLDQVPANETARRLSASVIGHVGDGLKDDASLFLIEYRGPTTPG